MYILGDFKNSFGYSGSYVHAKQSLNWFLASSRSVNYSVDTLQPRHKFFYLCTIPGMKVLYKCTLIHTYIDAFVLRLILLVAQLIGTKARLQNKKYFSLM
jgi:hypothetical protein